MKPKKAKLVVPTYVTVIVLAVALAIVILIYMKMGRGGAAPVIPEMQDYGQKVKEHVASGKPGLPPLPERLNVELRKAREKWLKEHGAAGRR